MKISNEKLLEQFKNKTNGKLNIAIFSDCYYPLVGGITLRVYNQAIELSKIANVIVVTGNVGKYQDDPNLPFAVVRCKGFKVSEYQGNVACPWADRKFKKFMQTLTIDVIHLHTYFAMAKSAYYFKKRMGMPIIQVSHQRLYPEYLTIVKSKFIARRLTNYSIKMINKADALWTVSQNVLNFYRESGITRDIVIDPSGSDRKYPENANELIAGVNEKYNLAPQDNVLLVLCRMEAQQKNLIFALDSLKLLKDKGVEFTAFFVGKGKDLNMLKDYAKKNGLENNVIFTGFVSDEEATALYLRADLHLFPSLNDNFGLTKVEAASLYTPTVALTGTAVAETIVDCQNGYVAERDITSFCDKIAFALSDKEKLKEVSNNAQQTMGQTWADLAKITLQNTLKVVDEYNAKKEENK